MHKGLLVFVHVSVLLRPVGQVGSTLLRTTVFVVTSCSGEEAQSTYTVALSSSKVSLDKPEWPVALEMTVTKGVSYVITLWVWRFSFPSHVGKHWHSGCGCWSQGLLGAAHNVRAVSNYNVSMSPSWWDGHTQSVGKSWRNWGLRIQTLFCQIRQNSHMQSAICLAFTANYRDVGQDGCAVT